MFSRLRELIRNGVDPRLLYDQSVLHGGKGGSPPPAPDYTGAAQAQAGASKENLTQQTWANRPNQITPWGSTNWGATAGTDPSSGQPITQWTQTESLNPQAQGALDQQLAIQQGRSGLAQGQMGRVGEAIEKPFNWEGMPAVPDSGDQASQQAYERSMKMQAPDIARASEDLDVRLANQGITPGSAAYETEHRRLSDAQSRQQLGTQLAATAEGRAQGGFQGQLRQARIAEEAQRRGMPLNELNALLTGQQVQTPQMPSFQGAGQATAPNLLGAATAEGAYGMNAYNAKQQAGQDLWGGVGKLAGTAASIYFSDERLKSNIERIGTHPIGVGIYEYDIFGRRERGVMAQELLPVAPHLVSIHESGYLMVNYGGF